jgi:Lrp/AsnC family transcriptional regulator, leucine-responsive regulatory protein
MPTNRRPNRRNADDAPIDAVNRRLLLELQADARLSLAELGRRVGLSAPAVGELHKVAELARQTPEVVECHRITGEDCFVMKLHLRDVEHMEEVIDRFLLHGQTTTSIVQSSPVAAHGLPLDADGGQPSG